ncbi:hypothetical protein SACC_12820 [Saccharolobus caldissimus]|uniref:Thymidylate kinase n=1 Tax=Saccharolobus caldissimus TaxID=1702097 RepID=A0AAQ4CR34_9CREN|nr:hypothetical protein [Saccharolobus caldissimus]BDB98265.1 hypothetical protein SACC_12820 [Saccharolobus caldissimus]
MIIAFEGIEGSGRTTHLNIAKKYLEEEGYGVITFGLQMSKLMGERIRGRTFIGFHDINPRPHTPCPAPHA